MGVRITWDLVYHANDNLQEKESLLDVLFIIVASYLSWGSIYKHRCAGYYRIVFLNNVIHEYHSFVSQ